MPDDPLDEGLTVVRVGKGYDKRGEKVKGLERGSHQVGQAQIKPDTIRDMALELFKSIAIVLGLIGLGAFFVAAESL